MRVSALVATIALLFAASSAVGSTLPKDANALEGRQSCPCSGGCIPGSVCCQKRCGCGDASDTTCL
ncbi:hypothetical protein BD626DRAFT_89764 [Schizophyllum amplum]|uniref:Uncharacterized protein n=1 Tax=Schizophyllum amplum TaxID=97359 RepID=A0A550C8E8_9AGAR|nr:hypothetical protein BD626DRAFT_89764 [Auriculariopsis ampla]